MAPHADESGAGASFSEMVVDLEKGRGDISNKLVDSIKGELMERESEQE